MKYSKLGRSNLTVSRICLGTMHFGPYATEAESFRIMDRAIELGINFFDTANVYGGPQDRGRSETIIGSWLTRSPEKRDRIVLASKVFGAMADPAQPNEARGISAYRVRKHLAASLNRLCTDHLDLYQVHHFDARGERRGILGHLRADGRRRRCPLYRVEQLSGMGPGEVPVARRAARFSRPGLRADPV